MSTVEQNDTKMTRLTAADPNLAFLATKAAIELGRISQGKSDRSQSIGELAFLLKNSTKQLTTTDEPSCLWDPATVSLIHSAMRTDTSRKIATIEELISEAFKISEQLESTSDPSSSVENIESLRTFCLALANSIIANERSQFEPYTEETLWH